MPKIEIYTKAFCPYCSRAMKLLEWMPQHRLKNALPDMVAALRRDPAGWYARNGVKPPPWIAQAASLGRRAGDIAERYRALVKRELRANRWAHLANIALGTWLITQPPLIDVEPDWLGYSEIALGAERAARRDDRGRPAQPRAVVQRHPVAGDPVDVDVLGDVDARGVRDAHPLVEQCLQGGVPVAHVPESYCRPTHPVQGWGRQSSRSAVDGGSGTGTGGAASPESSASRSARDGTCATRMPVIIRAAPT